jgi:hypothetical protein
MLPTVFRSVAVALLWAVTGATDEDSKRLLDALVGGPVEGLTLRSESRYGPPALR